MRFKIAYYDKGNRVTIAPEEQHMPGHPLSFLG